MSEERTADVLRVVEEDLRVDKRSSVTGKVRIRNVVDTVEEIASAVLEEERVEVTRVPVDRQVDARPPVRTEGDVTIIPVLEEVIVVEKRLILKEELHVRRTITHEHVEVPITLRKERAVVERVSKDPESSPAEEARS